MNKKFLSAILFGALMVTSTGTFVSCKDYDDDIDNLQTQIDKLATKDEMSSQIASLQSALSTAQSAATAAQTSAADALKKAEDALTKAEGAGSEAEAAAAQAAKDAAQAALDAANAKVEAIEAAKAEVATAKAALEEAVDGKFETLQTELSATVAELTAKVEELTGLTTEMITSIHLQEGYENAFDAYYDAEDLVIRYNQMPSAWGDKKTYVFGKGLEGELTLNANQRISKSTTFLIAVSPANAVVTSDMLSLINSKNESLDKYVSLSVEKYNGLLTRAAAGTGLYAVTATLNNEAKLDEFAKATWTATDSPYEVKFAVAATKDNRTVTTAYQLAVYAEEMTDGICDLADNSYIESSVKAKSLLGYYGQWMEGTTTNDEWCFPVAIAEDFTISVNPECGAVLASYVEVDYENSHLSTTDLAALKALTVKGVNKVSSTGVFTLSINGALAKGVVVPLKVHAIGYNGVAEETIVWVKAGNSTAITQTAAYVVTPEEFVATPTAYAFSGKQAFTVPAGAATFELSIYAKDEININAKTFYSVLDNPTLKFFKADGKTVATAVKDIAVAQLNATIDLQKMKDDKVYEGTVKFFNNEGTFLGQSAISIQKVLPKVAPEGFSIKTNQVVNGIYNCYLIPNNWNAEQATLGTMAMTQIFNFGVAPENYQIKFAKTGYNADADAYTNTVVVAGNNSVRVNKSLIDNKTEHATSVVYNYGLISSVKDADGNYVAHKLDVAEFATIYNCIFNSTYSFDWATRAQLGAPYTNKDSNGNYTTALPYKTAVTYGDTNFTVNTAHIFGTSAWDSDYSEFLSENVSLTIKEVTLTSDANGVEEYFDVTVSGDTLVFAPKSGATNPTSAVPSTLTIKCKDMYNDDIVITLAITVNKR